MGEDIIIIRLANGKTDYMPISIWREKRNAPEVRGLFRRIGIIKTPPEVVALKARQAAAKLQKG